MKTLQEIRAILAVASIFLGLAIIFPNVRLIGGAFVIVGLLVLLRWWFEADSVEGKTDADEIEAEEGSGDEATPEIRGREYIADLLGSSETADSEIVASLKEHVDALRKRGWSADDVACLTEIKINRYTGERAEWSSSSSSDSELAATV